MKNDDLKVLEAVNQLNGVLNDRQRYFIGAAIKDALVLGRYADLMTEDEAVAMYEVVEERILSEARKNETVADYLAKATDFTPTEKEREENGGMTPTDYYEVFVKPALEIICEEYSDLIGRLFVKYICTGEPPSEDALSADEKVLWNIFMATVEIKFISDI